MKTMETTRPPSCEVAETPRGENDKRPAKRVIRRIPPDHYTIFVPVTPRADDEQVVPEGTALSQRKRTAPEHLPQDVQTVKKGKLEAHPGLQPVSYPPVEPGSEKRKEDVEWVCMLGTDSSPETPCVNCPNPTNCVKPIDTVDAFLDLDKDGFNLLEMETTGTMFRDIDIHGRVSLLQAQFQIEKKIREEMQKSHERLSDKIHEELKCLREEMDDLRAEHHSFNQHLDDDHVSDVHGISKEDENSKFTCVEDKDTDPDQE